MKTFPIRNQQTSKAKRGRRRRHSLADLAMSLDLVDRERGPNFFNDAEPGKATANRRLVIAALDAVGSFLGSRDCVSVALFKLRNDLEAVELTGETPPLFKPARKRGRKPGDRFLQGLKGRFAGMTYLQMYSGMSLEQAANWMARNIPPTAACRLSQKPIRPSTIKEWMNQYGCNVRIRRELRSAKTPAEFKKITSERLRPKGNDGYFGQIAFLDVLLYGRACQAVGKPFPFKQRLQTYGSI